MACYSTGSDTIQKNNRITNYNGEISYKINQFKTNKGLKNYFYIITDIDTKQAAIVDPAWELDAIVDALAHLNVELKAILLTHSHDDHTNLVESLLERFNPDVYISRIETEYYNFKCSNLKPVDDMDVIRLGNTDITAIYTPGHTAGGLCYWLSNSLFTGDTIFIEGCGVCTDNGGDAAKMFDSIQKIKNIVNPEVNVYPGHSYGKRPGCKLSFLCEENIYFLFLEKEMFINYRTRSNQTNLLAFK